MQRRLVVTDVSEHPIPPNFKGQAVQETSVTKCVTSQKIKDLIYNAAEAWDHKLMLLLSFSWPGI